MKKLYKYELLFGKEYPGSYLTPFAINDARSRNSKGIRTKTMLDCRCRCGNIVTVNYSDIISGNTKSCGCYVKDHPTNIHNVLGKRYGKLLVVKRLEKRNFRYQWLCQCDCGGTIVLDEKKLRSGRYQACTQCTPLPKPNFKHGLYKTRIAKIYSGMKTRCYNPRNDSYEYYGARGIYICDEWLGKDGLINFYNWSIKHGYFEQNPKTTPKSQLITIDRIDNDGPYAPWNCRWTTIITQMNNTRQNVRITYHGVERTLQEWCNLTGANYDTVISLRLKRKVHLLTDAEALDIAIKKLDNPKLYFDEACGQWRDSDGFIRLIRKKI